MRFQILVIMMLLSINLCFTYDISGYPYKSKFDERFKKNVDAKTIINSLDDQDLDMVFSALKKAGEMRLTNARLKVEGLVASSNPQANLGKGEQATAYRHIFYMGILVLGKIGDDGDGGILGGYLWDLKKDKQGTIYVLSALGDLTNSRLALNLLNEYIPSIVTESDSRVVKQLVDSLLAHNSRSSIVPLMNVKQKVSQINRAYINEAIKLLNQTGVRSRG